MNLSWVQDALVKQSSSGGAWQQWGGGGVPDTVASQGNVGDGCIAEIAPCRDQDFSPSVTCDMFQSSPVSIFVGVVDVCFDECHGLDHSRGVGGRLVREDFSIIIYKAEFGKGRLGEECVGMSIQIGLNIDGVARTKQLPACAIEPIGMPREVLRHTVFETYGFEKGGGVFLSLFHFLSLGQGR